MDNERVLKIVEHSHIMNHNWEGRLSLVSYKVEEHGETIQLNKNNIMDTWLKQVLVSYLGEVPSEDQIKLKGEIIEYQRAIGQFSRYELVWENKVIGSLDMAQVMGAL